MTPALAVARRELRTFFNSPVAYIVLCGFLLLSGWLFFGTLFLGGQASLRGFFALAPLMFVVFAPAVTMKLVAEEKKSGTLELMLTLPVRDGELVAGKFLAALGMVAAGLLCTLPYAITVASLAAPGASFDWGSTAAGYFGLLLLAASFLSLGLWGSALSRNQIVAFIIGLTLCFSFYFVDKFAPLLPSALGSLFTWLSADYHFENLARGVVDTRDLLFYLSLTFAGLFLTTQALARARR